MRNLVRISKYNDIFAKGYFPNYTTKGFFVIKKIKNTVPWTYAISDLTVKKLLKRFTKRNCKKKLKKSLELKEQSREKVINCMLNTKPMIVLLIVVLIRRT